MLLRRGRPLRGGESTKIVLINEFVFIRHSNKFNEVTRYFAEYLRRTCGLTPIIVELMLGGDRLWTVAEKVKRYKQMCDSAIIIATPDETQDGKAVSRIDVNYEIGSLENKKFVLLKEKSTILPESVDAVCIPFSLDDPADCLDALYGELENIFGEGSLSNEPIVIEPPRHTTEATCAIEGSSLSPWQTERIEEEARRIVLGKTKEEQRSAVQQITRLLTSEDANTRWLAAVVIENLLCYDPSLVADETVAAMARDQFSSVRSCAAMCLFTLASLCPARVPLDVLMKLTSPNEDWYVCTPALAALKTMAHTASKAFDEILRMILSIDGDEARQGIEALINVVSNEPPIMTEAEIELLDKKNESAIVRVHLTRLREVIRSEVPGPNVIRYAPFYVES